MTLKTITSNSDPGCLRKERHFKFYLSVFDNSFSRLKCLTVCCSDFKKFYGSSNSCSLILFNAHFLIHLEFYEIFTSLVVRGLNLRCMLMTTSYIRTHSFFFNSYSNINMIFIPNYIYLLPIQFFM